MEEKIKDLLDYNYQMNQKLIQLFIENEAKTDARTTSLLSHILNAQQVWNSRILGQNSFGVWQINPTNQLKEINQNVYETSLEIIQNTPLDKVIRYKNTQGKHFSNSVCDILLHIVNHATYHRGQIATAFRLQEIVPLVTDYIFHRREELL
jgi:uncharacterized damage-inducible protein DinB